MITLPFTSDGSSWYLFTCLLIKAAPAAFNSLHLTKIMSEERAKGAIDVDAGGDWNHAILASLTLYLFCSAGINGSNSMVRRL